MNFKNRYVVGDDEAQRDPEPQEPNYLWVMMLRIRKAEKARRFYEERQLRKQQRKGAVDA